MSRTPPPEFPKFRVTIKGKDQYLRIGLVASALNSGFVPVEVGDEALEENFIIRPITDDERRQINYIADKLAAAK